MNLPDCTATILNLFKTIRHALIYHKKTLRSYNNFLSIFAYLITGNFEVSLDNDSYFTGESKYHVGTVLSGNFTGGDDVRGAGCTGTAPGKSFKMADDTLVYKAESNQIKEGDEKSQDPWDS